MSTRDLIEVLKNFNGAFTKDHNVLPDEFSDLHTSIFKMAFKNIETDRENLRRDMIQIGNDLKVAFKEAKEKITND